MPLALLRPLAALALAGTGVAAYGATADDDVHYRTVAAALGDVAAELTLSGTIAPTGSSELAFGTGGTVARVRVDQGDEVEQGQVVAVLDRSSLRAAVDRAKSDLADARARLAADRDVQATAVDDATSAPGKSSGGAADESSGSKGASSAVQAQLSAQQDAVTAAQSAASTALAAAADRLAEQQRACAEPVATEPEPSDDATTEATTEAATEATTSDVAASAVLSEACASALAAVQSAQSAASRAQTTLQTALETLGTTLAAALDAASATTPTTPTPPSSVPSAPTGSTRTVTAATLAEDQAAIDRADASLASARADLRGAVVRAPADGTVVSLTVGADDRVSAGDTVATLVAPGLTTATVEVSATEAARLTTGAPAEVTPAGATDALPGTVGRIEHTATDDSSEDGSSGDPTYAVEIVLDGRDLALADGLPATVVIEVGSADDVVVVPASAVSDGTVTVVDDSGTARRTPVTTGVVGATEVEIADGLHVGDRVVLADLDAALPTGDSDQRGPGAGLGGLDGEMVRMGPPGGGVTIRR
ncbi:efflux RND transporter periplasmic adaptor subunit [Nocardioides albidus]|uniref:Efflux RND transporter periplasmic adaptor subunit n=1 Tax=Nocardioides albidus TaxID=1517589 RepID=A0A5C4W197_9ACTN|nr:efflux RND transporter periplasmic adaptor subunit [Nocardioides albidus]TNM41265.1 efflux RND transporter periplasmic adaptor subunit [Nocardioides albidus]